MGNYAGKKILVEGWRHLPHSYALVNQFQCLEILRRPEITLRHRDMPLFLPGWKPVSGLFEPAVEAALSAIPAPLPDEHFDAILRIDYPHRLNPGNARRTCVFMTAEFRALPQTNLAPGHRLTQQTSEDIVYITPSQWSRQGILDSQPGTARVVVIPHGIDPAIFHPVSPEEREQARRRLGLSGVVFANMGAMTTNKNISGLLKAFAAVAARHPEARLLLKGLGSLYASRQQAQHAGKLLSPAEVALVNPRLTYIDNTFTCASMADIYRSIDAYVSPYFAEGFNLPVLEAMACGTPVICTAGGSTDDFTHPDFALRIDSVERQIIIDKMPGFCREPSLEQLTSHMISIIENPDMARRTHSAGPAFVANGYHWSQVVDRLLAVMLD